MTDQPMVRTPKRKRGETTFSGPPIYPTTQFSFRVPEAQDEEAAGSASPRARFVHKFKGLHLHDQSGGGVTPDSASRATNDSVTPRANPDTESHTEPIFHQAQIVSAQPHHDDHVHNSDNDDDENARKRQKVPQIVMQDADDAEASDTIYVHAHSLPIPPTVPPPEPEPETVPADSSASIEAGPKRLGTPPLRKNRNKKAIPGDDSEDEGPVIVDPVRAALTWQEDEITVYDPDDSDDDGTGVNGVGFKPTPAIARMRVQKRRQQLAEYRRREEREARALRSYRRRGGSGGGGAASLPGAVVADTNESAEASRRVRFMEVEVSAVVMTS
ncbi:hypothetical protein ACRALDRAFT_2030304 [Sodiomyces alcalophilus JCM 7366]|uniref:uncharacterized protein n=1 Tax=Sodiomyces alcalophilus JCM 7366 TaxID=591952 RepID=UPI0039B57E41